MALKENNDELIDRGIEKKSPDETSAGISQIHTHHPIYK